MKTDELRQILEILTRSNIRFISGKYFRDNQEIKHIDNYIIKCSADVGFPKSADIDEIKKQLVIRSEEEIWPELPIVEKARLLHNGENHKNIELPFPLDNKQLLILYIMLFHPDEEVMFITTGVGGSGKSTFLNIVRQIFENDNAAIPLSELNGFMVAEAVSKRLISSDELGKGDLDTKILKTLISKQPLDVNPKYGRPFHAQCQSNLFYCCNKAPRIDVTDTGILRRIIFYERNTPIKNPIRDLNRKKFSEDELLKIVIRCLDFEAVYNNWREYFNTETHKYLMKDNSVYLAKDMRTYSDYRTYCQDHGLKAYSEPNQKDIRDLFKGWIKEDDKQTL